MIYLVPGEEKERLITGQFARIATCPGEYYEDLEATSEQYLLLTSGLRLVWLCPGTEAAAGMQEAEITRICKGNGGHPARVKGTVWFFLFSHYAGLPSPSGQHHHQETNSFLSAPESTGPHRNDNSLIWHMQ